MSVSVRIPTILRSYTGGTAVVTGAPGTVRQLIDGLDADYPGIGGRLLDDSGQLRRFVNVYVNDDDIRLSEGLDTPVASGGQVSVIPAVAGG
ncbi:MAG TPA: MoaD/ThiS family protein [Streptosporangiaceae bacterium]|jgi:molybdopterin converting factor small subunit|nr:MoaD/ThiS family protein [Streptosporangiaceae bacterium]